MWRPDPDEWEKLVKENLDWTDRPSVEAGADIILKVLRDMGVLPYWISKEIPKSEET